MKKTIVSIIVPIYNVEKYLDKCLKSIVNQTYKDLEIILINDGSTDKSPKIAKKYAKLDKRILYLSQPNKGLGATRNIGIKIAQSKYITFVDSDDELPIKAIEFHMNNIKKTKCDISFGNIVNKYKNSISIDKPKLSNDFLKDILSLQIDVSSCNKIYKKNLFIKNNIYFLANMYHEDYLPLIKLFYFSKKPSYVDTNTYIYYHMNTNSITKNIGLKNFRDIFTVFNLVYRFLSQNKIINKYYLSFTIMVYTVLNFMLISHTKNKQEIIHSSNLLIEEITKNKKIFKRKYLKEVCKENPNRYALFIYNLSVFIHHNKYIDIDISKLLIYMTKNHMNLLHNVKKPLLYFIFNYIKNSNFQEIIIYGAGEIFLRLEKKLKQMDIKILHIIDKKAENKEFIIGKYKVKSKSSLKSNPNTPIFIASFAYADEIVKDLKKYKKENGLKNDIYDLHRCIKKDR